MTRLLLSGALICALAAGCLDDRPGDPEDGSADALDADGTADLPDAVPDAGDGAVTQYDFCDQALFELPRGPDDLLRGLDLWGGRVVHARKIGGASGPPPQVFLLDLQTCVERELTKNAVASSCHLWGDSVFFDDRRNKDNPDSSRDIYHFDIEQGTEELVAGGPLPSWNPMGNDQYVVFYRYIQYIIGSPIELILVDLQTRQEQLLAPDWVVPAYYAISERYVTWTGYTQDPQSVGKDVFYHDLVTGQTAHVDSSYVGYQYGVSAWGDYLAWFGSDINMSDPYHLMLYHIPTGDSTVVVDDDVTVRWGQIHRNLVAYNTSRYQGTTTQSDIELYDITTDTRRRVTAQSGDLMVERLSFPYLLIMDAVSPETFSRSPRYIVNLVLLGLTDENGNLLPGDGVVALP